MLLKNNVTNGTINKTYCNTRLSFYTIVSSKHNKIRKELQNKEKKGSDVLKSAV